ncbi:unknown [Haloarcula marismortui ATCC 43049]|uniref:Transposase n=1 Tax=Haloarcula marismortui (strain ATCC 43049 / DSM 3752 / JCM 8966 / VKM B-1809) TaxID=272569 RepID=Q5UWA9_HALMA|nr:unknown [Haloarcula marismortui ATCC 43049]
MQLADLLRETLDEDNQDVWENERTPTPVRRFGVRLHTAVNSNRPLMRSHSPTTSTSSRRNSHSASTASIRRTIEHGSPSMDSPMGLRSPISTVSLPGISRPKSTKRRVSLTAPTDCSSVTSTLTNRIVERDWQRTCLTVSDTGHTTPGVKSSVSIRMSTTTDPTPSTRSSGSNRRSVIW